MSSPKERGELPPEHPVRRQVEEGSAASHAAMPSVKLPLSPGPASVSPADLMGELTALADAFYRVVEYLRAWTPPITESEAAEIADAALFRAEKVIARGR